MTSSPEEPGTGHAGTPSAVASRIVQWAATRVELIAFELDDEKRIAARDLSRLAAGVACALFSVALLVLGVILIAPPPWRPWVALAFALGFGAAGAVLFRSTLQARRNRPPPFALTLEELKRDREWLKTLK